MPDAKVYIVCEPKRRIAGEAVRSVDLTPAASWGEPIILLQNSQSSLDPSATIELLEERLAKFGEDDYLVPVGDPVLMCAAATIAAFRNSGRVKLLKWDRIQHVYIPIQMDIKEFA